MKGMYARITIGPSRNGLLSDIRRLVEALWYVTRMRRAGVPEKRIRKIAARWRPWPWAMRQEMAELVRDIARRTP